MPITKVIVNQCATSGIGGSYYNCFAPSTTLGCGSWGNNAITENLSYKHLINITTISYCLENVKIPTEKELWSLKLCERKGREDEIVKVKER